MYHLLKSEDFLRQIFQFYILFSDTIENRNFKGFFLKKNYTVQMNSLALASSLSVLNSVSNVNAINTLSMGEKDKNDKMLTTTKRTYW